MEVLRVMLVLKKTNIFWFCLGLFWILENLAPHSTLSQVSMVIMMVSLGTYCLHQRKLKISPVLTSYSIVIILQVFYVLSGLVVNASVTIDDIVTMLICLTSGILIYSFFYTIGDEDAIGDFFIYTGFVSLIIVMFLCRDSILTGRMAHAYGEDAISYYFLGKPVAISSNGIATYSCFGFFFCTNKHYKDKKIRWLFVNVVFIIGIILTGSRKGILMLAALWMICEIVIKKNRVIAFKVVCIIAALTIGYIAIIRIPVLRNIIGERLEDLLLNILTGATVSEGSMTARARYASYARDIISQNYLLGNGLGWFKSVYGNVTENNYYELLVGCGILGLIFNYTFVIPLIRKMYRFRYNKMCFAMGLVVVVMLIMQWGSVVYLSRSTLIYESLFFITADRALIKDKLDSDRSIKSTLY